MDMTTVTQKVTLLAWQSSWRVTKGKFKHDYLFFSVKSQSAVSGFSHLTIFFLLNFSETYGDGKGQSGDVLLFEGIWNVSVSAINDQEFKLLTDPPGMTVVKFYPIFSNLIQFDTIHKLQNLDLI